MVGANVLQRTLGDDSNKLYGINVGGAYSIIPKLQSGLTLNNFIRGNSKDTQDLLPALAGAGYPISWERIVHIEVVAGIRVVVRLRTHGGSPFGAGCR